MKLFVDFWKFTHFWLFSHGWEHKIVFVLILDVQNNFMFPTMGEQSKVGKFSEINKQFHVKSWLTYRSYSSVWWILSCTCFRKCIPGDVIGAAKAAGNLNYLLRILSDLDYIDDLKKMKAVTIFAPSDKAFDQIPHWNFEGLFDYYCENWRRALINRHTMLNTTLLLADIPGYTRSFK